jgi:hypothetical protein
MYQIISVETVAAGAAALTTLVAVFVTVIGLVFGARG